MVFLSCFGLCVMRIYELVNFSSMLVLTLVESVVTLSLGLVVFLVHLVFHLLVEGRCLGHGVLEGLDGDGSLFLCRVMLVVELSFLIVMEMLYSYHFLSVEFVFLLMLLVDVNQFLELTCVNFDLVVVFIGHLFHLLLQKCSHFFALLGHIFVLGNICTKVVLDHKFLGNSDKVGLVLIAFVFLFHQLNLEVGVLLAFEKLVGEGNS
jgi:hypothetical protein